MTTLVTGASGHLGGNLVRALLAQGRTVRAMVYEDTRAIDGLEIERVKGDILTPDTLKAAFDGVDTAYHLAAGISVAGDPGGLMERLNVKGTRNVVAASLEAGIRRLVHFSSIHAFSANPVDGTIDETRARASGKGVIAYDRTKAMGEGEVQKGIEKGLDAVIVNPSGVIGRFDYKPSRMGEVILDLCRGTMPALVGAGFNWVDVRDVVEGAINAEKKGRRGENYLLTGHWVPFPELADVVAEASGRPRPKFVSPMWLARIGAPFVTSFSRITGKRPRYTSESLRVLCNHRHISHQKATKELGYKPHPFKETITDTVNWFKKAGYY